MSENSIAWRLGLSLLIKLFASVRHPRKSAVVSMAVTVAVAITVTCVWYWRDTYTTGASEWRTVSLRDGSVIRLGPRTEIKVRFDRQQRHIEQFSGEATYDVAKDPYRPFIVACGIASVQAIGTKFAVDCDQDVNVTVAEGTVTVSRGLVHSGQVPSVDYVRADAGQQVLVSLWTPLTPKDVDIKVELAWEQRRIIFRGTPVEEAISEFNRRHKQQIILPRVYDPKFKVFGDYDLENPEDFIRVLKTSPATQPPR